MAGPARFGKRTLSARIRIAFTKSAPSPIVRYKTLTSINTLNRRPLEPFSNTNHVVYAYRHEFRPYSPAKPSANFKTKSFTWIHLTTRHGRVAGVARWTRTHRDVVSGRAIRVPAALSRAHIFALVVTASLRVRAVLIHCERNKYGSCSIRVREKESDGERPRYNGHTGTNNSRGSVRSIRRIWLSRFRQQIAPAIEPGASPSTVYLHPVVTELNDTEPYWFNSPSLSRYGKKRVTRTPGGKFSGYYVIRIKGLFNK